MSNELFLLRLVLFFRMRYIFLVCFVIQGIASERLLDVFFRDLVLNTTAGYVLFGDKPVDLQGFRELDQTIPGTIERKRAVIGLLITQYLETHPVTKSNYIISIYPIETGYEILTINKKSFLQTVKNHALLFNARFGFECSPEILLNQLVSNGFRQIFNKEIALQGIILGYGTENAFAYANGVSALKKFNDKTLPPFKSGIGYQNPTPIKDPQLLHQLNALVCYMPEHPADRTKIPFSYLKNSKKSKKLINKYQKAQLKIDKILRKPLFLEEICNRFGVTHAEQVDAQLSSPFDEAEKSVLSLLVAKILKQTFPKQISKEFILGMKDADKGDVIDAREVQFLDILWKRGSALTSRSDKWISDLAYLKEVECKIPGYLYISTIKSSLEDAIVTPNHGILKVRYLIQDINRTALVGSFDMLDPTTFHLEELVPGLAHGLIGMRKGEIREIYIHPDFAYGPTCETGDGNVLIAKVELLDFEPSDGIWHLPLLQPIDALHCSPKIRSVDELISLLKKHAYFCGFRSWVYYKYAEPLINLEEVLDYIKKEDANCLSKSETSTLLKLEYLLNART